MRKLLLVISLTAASILALGGPASACGCWYGYAGYAYYGYYTPRVVPYSWGPPIYYGYRPRVYGYNRPWLGRRRW
jgi:hypothetical protein